MLPDVAKNLLLKVVVGWLAFVPLLAKAQITTDYSFTQVNGTNVYEDSLGGSAPIPTRDETEQADSNSTYHFILSALSGPTSLSASASLNLSIDHSGATEVFDSVVATAQAKSTFAQFATVQGVDGYPGGTIVIHWAIDGTTALSLTTTGGIRVQNISNTARLVSNIPGHGGLIFQDILDTPFQYQPGQVANNVNFNPSFPIASGALVFEVPWTAGSPAPLFFDLCLDIITMFENIDASEVESGLNLNLSNTAVLTIEEIRGIDGESEVVIPGATLQLQDPVSCMCNRLSTSDFKPPMGKKKKLGSTLPVKFQLYFDGIEVTSEEQLNSILTENGCEADCPHIRIFNISGANIELPEDSSEDNVGDADAGDCFRYSDGNWIFNLRLGSAFASGGEYMVDVVIGECVLGHDNGLENKLFQIK